jgi:large subunit ribosomal protein L3
MANHNLGLLGRKLGMTRIFADDGTITPVTVIAVGPCPVLQIKNSETDGYTALQVGYDSIPERKSNKPTLGHQAKAGKGCFRFAREFRIQDVSEYAVGQDLTTELFKRGDRVKVTGTSKGKGFQGVIKRHNFKGMRASHGAEKVHRSPGSVGNNTYPGRVIPGKKMPGHMGDRRVTYKNLEVIEVRPEENVILIRGQIPGAKNSLIMVRKQS